MHEVCHGIRRCKGNISAFVAPKEVSFFVVLNESVTADLAFIDSRPGPSSEHVVHTNKQ